MPLCPWLVPRRIIFLKHKDECDHTYTKYRILCVQSSVSMVLWKNPEMSSCFALEMMYGEALPLYHFQNSKVKRIVHNGHGDLRR